MELQGINVKVANYPRILGDKPLDLYNGVENIGCDAVITEGYAIIKFTEFAYSIQQSMA